jgi:hypothetical protein
MTRFHFHLRPSCGSQQSRSGPVRRTVIEQTESENRRQARDRQSSTRTRTVMSVLIVVAPEHPQKSIILSGRLNTNEAIDGRHAASDCSSQAQR